MRPPRSRGFTLIEVIAAIALLGLAFAVLLGAMGSSVRLTSNAADRSRAAMWAQSQLDSSFVMTPVRAGVTQGRFDDRFSWRMDVRPWQPPPPPRDARDQPGQDDEDGGLPQIQMFRIDLAVMWGQGRRQRSAHFITLRAQNPPSEDDEP